MFLKNLHLCVRKQCILLFYGGLFTLRLYSVYLFFSELAVTVYPCSIASDACLVAYYSHMKKHSLSLSSTHQILSYYSTVQDKAFRNMLCFHFTAYDNAPRTYYTTLSRSLCSIFVIVQLLTWLWSCSLGKFAFPCTSQCCPLFLFYNCFVDLHWWKWFFKLMSNEWHVSSRSLCR